MTPPNLAVLAHMEKTFPFGLGMANLATRVVIVWTIFSFWSLDGDVGQRS